MTKESASESERLRDVKNALSQDTERYKTLYVELVTWVLSGIVW